MNRSLMLCLAVILPETATASNFHLAEPSDDRWMYPSNSTPGTRSQASTFSALPDGSGVDERWAFFLIGFETGRIIPPGLEAWRYRIRTMHVTARIGQDLVFRYDPTSDPWDSHGTPQTPAAVADPDVGRPLELFGAGFRNGFTAASYTEFSPYGGNTPGTRNAFPLGFDPGGQPRDISNHVTGRFDPAPWAVGRMDLTAGDQVPQNSVVTFEIDATRAGTASYLQQGLAAGKLWFTLTSMHPASFQGGEFVSYHTRDGFEHFLFGDAAPTWTADIEIDHPLAIRSEGGGLTFNWPVSAGFSYALQASADLTATSWSVVHQVDASADGQAVFSQPLETGGQRFFRLAITPHTP